MAMVAKIRRMYFREHLSISEIQRRTSLSLNTIKTWLRKPEGSEPVYRRQGVPTKLTAIPGFGLEAVVIAVELALESGAANAEHVLNILARLNQPPAPEPIPTALEIQEAPTADSGRYDRLHTIGANHV